MSYTAPRFYEIIKDTSSCQITVNSIEDLSSNPEINFTTVPNPSSNSVTIFSSSIETRISAATMVDINGRIVRKIEGNKSYYTVIPVEDLANGMYAIEIKTTDGLQSVKKVIVQH
jgi:hypothetical protein